MEVSIVIPTYGHPEYLAESIKSVIEQSFTDWELIVVDDNNPNTKDRQYTEKLMKEFMQHDSRIKYIKHDRNRNGAVARNTGFAVAQGKYISLLDSDDLYMPSRLQRCLEVMRGADLRIAGVYTGCEFRRKGKVYYKSVGTVAGNHLVKTLACTFAFYTGSNIFVRKEVVNQLNGFDPSFLRHQDYEFLVRLFQNYDLAAIQEILVIKNNENFNLPNARKSLAIKNQYLEKYDSIIKNLPDTDQNYIYQRQWIAVGELAMRDHDFQLAYTYYRKSMCYGRLNKKDIKRMLLLPFVNFFRYFF